MEANGPRSRQRPVIVSGATGGVGSIAIDVLSRLGYRAVGAHRQRERSWLFEGGSVQRK